MQPFFVLMINRVDESFERKRGCYAWFEPKASTVPILMLMNKRLFIYASCFNQARCTKQVTVDFIACTLSRFGEGCLKRKWKGRFQL